MKLHLKSGLWYFVIYSLFGIDFFLSNAGFMWWGLCAWTSGIICFVFMSRDFYNTGKEEAKK